MPNRSFALRICSFLVTSAFVALAPAGMAAELTGTETATLVARLQEHRAKFPSLTADFTEQKASHLLQKPLVTTGTLAFTAPNLFRREVKGANPSLTVCDGTQLWIYYPNFKEAEHYTLGQRSFFDDSLAALTAGLNFQNIAKYYRYEAFSESDGYRLVMHPRTGGLKRMLKQLTVWITSDYLIAKTESLLPKNDRVETTYRNQKSQKVPSSAFAFTPAPDVKVSTPLGK